MYPLGNDEPVSRLAFKYAGKISYLGGLPGTNNSAVLSLDWFTGGNVMASGMKTGKGHWRYTVIKPNRHDGIPVAYQLVKTKENEQTGGDLAEKIGLIRAKLASLIRLSFKETILICKQ